MAGDNRFAEGYWRRRDLGPAGTRSEVVTGPVADWVTDRQRTRWIRLWLLTTP